MVPEPTEPTDTRGGQLEQTSSQAPARRRSSAPDLFFLALLPPSEIQNPVRQLQTEMVERFDSRAALRSPPHITLFPPFRYTLPLDASLAQQLQSFADNHGPVAIELRNFGAFKPKVIYVHVEKTPGLLALQQQLDLYLTQELSIHHDRPQRPFAPHITLAYRDLRRAKFQEAWPEFEERSFQAEFTVPELTLLRHVGGKWQIAQQFPLLK